VIGIRVTKNLLADLAQEVAASAEKRLPSGKKEGEDAQHCTTSVANRAAARQAATALSL
jgi:hypothetical protein